MLQSPEFKTQFHTSEFSPAIKFNSYGLRDREYTFEKESNTFRILAIGDSMTFGFGVEGYEAYPKVLEVLLNDMGLMKRYEVINISTLGVGPVKYLDFLEMLGLRFHPGLVIIGFSLPNDIFDDLSTSIDLDSPIKKFDSFLKRTSYFYCFLKTKIQIMKGKLRIRKVVKRLLRDFGPDYVRYLAQRGKVSIETMRERIDCIDPSIIEKAKKDLVTRWVLEIGLTFPDVNEKLFSPYSFEPVKGWEKSKKALGRIKDLCDDLRIKMMVVAIPSGNQINQIYWTEKEKYGFTFSPDCLKKSKLQKVLARFCEEKGIYFLDLWEPFKERKEDTHYFIKDGHWNRKGHLLAAREIAQKLIFFGIISPEDLEKLKAIHQKEIR